MKLGYLLLTLIFVVACKGNSEEQGKVAATAQKEFSPEVKESISRGARIYNNFCASCHLSGGEGIAGTFPPLKDSDWLTEKRAETISAIKHGIRGPIVVNDVKYDNLMPDLGLTDEEVADVLNYIHSSWGNKMKEPYTVEEVAAIEK